MSHDNYSMGWLRDYPDFRDYTIKKDEVSSKHQLLGSKESVYSMLERVGVLNASTRALPASVAKDSLWNAIEVEDQGDIGSCTAQACVGLVEYFEQKAFGKHINASRLFLYKVTRNLLQWHNDQGAFLRTTMAALAMFGVPPEKYWPYTDDPVGFNGEPTPFCYSLAQNFQAIQYYRLDPLGQSRVLCK